MELLEFHFSFFVISLIGLNDHHQLKPRPNLTLTVYLMEKGEKNLSESNHSIGIQRDDAITARWEKKTSFILSSSEIDLMPCWIVPHTVTFFSLLNCVAVKPCRKTKKKNTHNLVPLNKNSPNPNMYSGIWLVLIQQSEVLQCAQYVLCS